MEKELPHVIVSTRREAAIKADLQRRRGSFITERLDQKRSELGNKAFEKQRAKLTEEFKQRWEQLQKAKTTLRELEDQMNVKLMEWAPLEKVYHAQFEAEGCSKDMVEKTVTARRGDFERAQRIVQERLQPKFDLHEDFKRRILDPATRKEAIRYYLIDRTDKKHFLIEALDLIFEELSKLRR